MYLRMVQAWFSSLFQRGSRTLMRSGMVTELILVLLIVVLSIAYREQGRGNLHKLKAKIATPERQNTAVIRVGGQEPIKLERPRLIGASMPEFLSATMLPGRGMNVLQITAYVPGKGEVNLMASPSVEDAAKTMTGSGSDANGEASMEMGGAFELPWADTIWAESPAVDRISLPWHGHAITLPADSAHGQASGGLLLAKAATTATSSALPDGGQVDATFDLGDFGAHWPSKTHATITVLLSGHSMAMTVIARNTGDVAEPIAIGWHPRFAIADRSQVKLRIPADKRVDIRDRQTGIPSGAVVPADGTPYDFNDPNGAPLGNISLDECFVDLRQNLLDSGPVVEFTDPVGGYGLRITALSTSIKAMRVVSPAGAKYVTIEPQTNYPDPFGREWPKNVDTGVVTLQPGQAVRWQIRLELFSLSNGSPEQ